MSDLPVHLREDLTRVYTKFHHQEGIPKFKDFTTGRTMIDECELMCRLHRVSRSEADEYAALSYTRAIEAQEKNLLTDRVTIKVDADVIADKDYPMQPTSLDVLSKLNAVSTDFSKKWGLGNSPNKFGTVTAGNSSKIADGGAVVLISSEKKALDFGYQPLATIKDYVTTCHNPENDFLGGSVYAIAKLMKKNRLKFSDIGVWEIHEAFAAQIVYTLKCLNDEHFLQQNLNISESFGKLTPNDINKCGGTLAFGHPLSATGSRLINMACQQLKLKNEKYAIVCSCATGGQV
ncbi:Trifunctional enzyme subunit beta, mitochondrial [Thelohanellus kitauei]|uniref:acetyl-CoA C-acyltransferase n=1 Tax=Thelohanellus kitauei TaxID=669202 RepID=A0A0C2IQE7_THEKT|nr:Trifunctional enzyme subunit beta, mitochondrial [Thelohanellus kitauei]